MLEGCQKRSKLILEICVSTGTSKYKGATVDRSYDE